MPWIDSRDSEPRHLTLSNADASLFFMYSWGAYRTYIYSMASLLDFTHNQKISKLLGLHL